jgi:hypothetical protein
VFASRNVVFFDEEIRMSTTPQQTETYTCPMHPEVQQDRPGNCPKCGMPLVPEEQQPGPRNTPGMT